MRKKAPEKGLKRWKKQTESFVEYTMEKLKNAFGGGGRHKKLKTQRELILVSIGMLNLFNFLGRPLSVLD